MNTFFSVKNTCALFLIIVVGAACKQPETIVVDRDPETVVSPDTLDQAPDEPRDATFQQLNIGELQSISSLDPLLAATTSDLRAIQLLYEGLVRFSETGEIVPAIAQEWSIDNSNRRYTFHLRPDVYFHNSDVFGSGTGRKLTSGDVKFVFERMAKRNVPPHTAQLFMDIAGFNPYFQEQRQIYNSRLRQLEGISGIQTPNDTTVVFQLNQPDPDFLQKLAIPLAVIYPKEAINNARDGFAVVGTGPFAFSQRSNDSTYVFSRFDNYYAASDIQLNRIDVITSDNELSLFEAMEAGNIHYLPELGPALSQQVLTEDAEFVTSYGDRYTLSRSDSIEYVLRRYLPSGLSQDRAADIAQLAENNATSLFSALGPAVTPSSFSTDDSKISSMSNLNLEASATDDPYAKVFLQQLSDLLEEQDGQLTINDILVPTQQTGLFVTRHLPHFPFMEWEGHPATISFTIQPLSLKRQNIENLVPNRYSWWIDPRGVELSTLENAN